MPQHYSEHGQLMHHSGWLCDGLSRLNFQQQQQELGIIRFAKRLDQHLGQPSCLEYSDFLFRMEVIFPEIAM
jgi:hypothetical protein